MFFSRFLSSCEYGCLEEVLNVIQSINSIVYLLVNQSESYDILSIRSVARLTSNH